MGIFDAWQYDPRTYQPQGVGLLDQIMPQWAAPAQAPGMPQGGASFPAVNGQPEFSMVSGSLGSGLPVPTFGKPDPAALPPTAQPAQAQLQPQQAMSPGFGDRASGGFRGFVENLHTGPIGALFGAVGGAVDGGQRENQTTKALEARGLDPAIAKQVARDPALLRAVVTQALTPKKQTDDIEEYLFAKKENPSLTFDQHMMKKRANSGEYGMQPIWGTGPDGKPAVLQLGKSGDAKQSVLPPGFNLARDPIKVEGPTGTTILDPQTRQQVGFIPKEIAQAKIAEARGEAQGAAQVALPQVLANAEQTLATIKSIKDDPYRERGTGASSLFNFVPGTGGYDFSQKVEQLKGKTFLEAFQSLKGGGAITEMEGRKAENAIARLSVAQSEGAFLDALNELEAVVKTGIERSKQKAGVAAPNAPPATNLKSKYGLD